MAKLLYNLEGVRGRSIMIYDRKCVFTTKATVGSFLTGNVTDGEKTIFFDDVVGVQFKRSGALIGYLQFETGSVQMNNQGSNMFSENTFTFENGTNGITNELMEAIYHQICDIIEQLKYGDTPAPNVTPIAVPAYTPASAPAPAPPPAPAPAPAAVGQFCPNCGQKNDPDSRFCLHCGSPLT